MVQKTENFNEARNIARSLVEGVVDEVMKTVLERKDTCFASLETVKVQFTEDEDILAFHAGKVGIIEQSKVLETLGAPLSTTPVLNDGCYPNLTDLQDVCVLSSAQTSSSKQGEGDYQAPTIREATAFYRLGLETDECCQGRSQYRKSFSISSLNTETSTNELIAEMRSDINDLSFDNIQLSDTDADDEPLVSLDRADNVVLTPEVEDKTCCLISHEGHCLTEEDASKDALQDDTCIINRTCSQQIHKKEFTPSCESETLEDKDVDAFFQNVSEDCQSSSSHKDLHHSKKFCQFNNKRYFPLNSEMSYDYFQQDSPSPYNQHTNEDEEDYELLSESSHEMINVEGEEDSFDLERSFHVTNPFVDPFLSPNVPSSLVISIDGPPNVQDDSEGKEREINTITVVAEVEHPKEVVNWEEALEVQLNVTEPVKTSETDNEEEGDDVIQSREYWSNVGLMIEHDVDPTYLGPSIVPGIESVKGAKRVQEKCLGHETDDEIWVSQSQSMDDIALQTKQEFREDDKVNYLSFPREADEKKKKKRLLSRISTSIFCIFRSKKKDSKLHS